MNDPKTISTRSDLLKLLCEAAELEHGIACSYLYAGFSLKRDISEGGITWEEQQTVRRWAAQIYFIASQEMLHLALVWNMTTAIGGTPYYLRPNFPQPSKYCNWCSIELEPFGPRSLRRFILYEHPQDIAPARKLKRLLALAGEDAEEIEFGTVGEMYRLIESGFRSIPEKDLFIGSKTQQMTSDRVHFPDLVAVVDRDSAIAAIEEITHQGEGRAQDREDSHFGVFVGMLKEILDAKSGDFSPARPAMRNPSARMERSYGAKSNPIGNPLAAQVAALFDSVYSLMLRILAWSFEFNSAGAEAQIRKVCSVAIDHDARRAASVGRRANAHACRTKVSGKNGRSGLCPDPPRHVAAGYEKRASALQGEAAGAFRSGPDSAQRATPRPGQERMQTSGKYR
jgi:hypothetical protein